MKFASIKTSFPRQLKTVRAAAAVLAATGSLLAAAPALAEGYPSKPITVVVPFSAGGPTDVVARLLAVPMGKSLGQTVIIDNALGAGGTIASAKVARAQPDGYTVLLHHMGMATAPALYRKLSFDPMKDFEYVGQVLDVPMTILGRKDLPANNFTELQTFIKTKGKDVTLANAGLGAVSHLCGLMFMSALNTEMTTVPYKGTGPAMNDLLGGQVDLLCDQTTQTVPYIQEGRIKAFGVTTPKRLAQIPKVPTLDEQGLKGFEVKVWHGMYAPKGTPKEAVDRLNKALLAALADPAVKKRLGEMNAEIPAPAKITPDGLKTHLQAEIGKWGPVIKKAGIYAD